MVHILSIYDMVNNGISFAKGLNQWKGLPIQRKEMVLLVFWIDLDTPT